MSHPQNRFSIRFSFDRFALVFTRYPALREKHEKHTINLVGAMLIVFPCNTYDSEENIIVGNFQAMTQKFLMKTTINEMHNLYFFIS